MFDSEAAARSVQARFPRLGDTLAEMRIDGGCGIWFAKTLGPRHYSVWGRPGDLAAAIVSVVALENP